MNFVTIIVFPEKKAQEQSVYLCVCKTVIIQTKQMSSYGTLIYCKHFDRNINYKYYNIYFNGEIIKLINISAPDKKG